MVFAMFMIVLQFQSEVVLHQRSFKPLSRPESIKRVRDEDGDDDDNNNSSLPNYPLLNMDIHIKMIHRLIHETQGPCGI